MEINAIQVLCDAIIKRNVTQERDTELFRLADAARAELAAIREENAKLREALEEVIWEHEEHGPNVLTCREMELMKDALSGELSRMSQAEMLDRQHAVGYRDAHADIQEQGKALVDRENMKVIEWAESEPGIMRCPWCERTEIQGHAVGCWLARVLKEPS